MMDTSTLIVYGSSRSYGNTRKAVDIITQHIDGSKIIDLNDYAISYFDYTNNNRHDDFIPIMHQLLKFERIIMATPVYWYSMSAQLKTFLDRFSDLLTFEKEMGRQLRGKSLGSVSSSESESLPSGFEMPFRETATYLGMTYLGHIHIPIIADGPLSQKLLDTITNKFG